MPKPRFKFYSNKYETPPACLGGCDTAFVGKAVDDRGKASIAALTASSSTICSVEFEPEDQNLRVDGINTTPERIAEQFEGKTRIVLDATTLGLGEVLHILMSIRLADSGSVEFLYAEPKSYTRNINSEESNSSQKKYDLTRNREFIAINGFNSVYKGNSEAAHVIFLGFEASRVVNALTQRDINPENYQILPVIGVPAFQAGWELNSIKPHLSFFEDQKISQSMISYCPADSVKEAYFTLWELYERLRNRRRLFYVSPLGTKPHTIATTLFLLETKGDIWTTSLYYDHPQRVDERSTGQSTWHHVKVEF